MMSLADSSAPPDATQFYFNHEELRRVNAPMVSLPCMNERKAPQTDGATPPPMDEPNAAQTQAERIRTSQDLGRCSVLLRLFEFRLPQSPTGCQPK